MMDKFTEKRLRDEAIVRAQDRAGLRKPHHSWLGGATRVYGPEAIGLLPDRRSDKHLASESRDTG
jgi:hypothetical protein